MREHSRGCRQGGGGCQAAALSSSSGDSFWMSEWKSKRQENWRDSCRTEGFSICCSRVNRTLTRANSDLNRSEFGRGWRRTFCGVLTQIDCMATCRRFSGTWDRSRRRPPTVEVGFCGRFASGTLFKQLNRRSGVTLPQLTMRNQRDKIVLRMWRFDL
jgi:hypothetical protein